MMNPGGTGRPRLVISARLAPLPPSRSFWSLSPSAKSYTYLTIVRSHLAGRRLGAIEASVPVGHEGSTGLNRSGRARTTTVVVPATPAATGAASVRGNTAP